MLIGNPLVGFYGAPANRTISLASGTTSSYSLDGITWSAGGTATTSCDWRHVAYGNGTHVAVANNDIVSGQTNKSKYSTNGGVSWTEVNLPVTRGWTGLTFAAGMFVAIGGGGPSGDGYYSDTVIRSTDGITWNSATMPTKRWWWGMAHNGTVFCTMGPGASNARAATSTDAITWTERTVTGNSGANTRWGAFGSGVFCFMDNNNAVCWTSSDGITWTQRTMSSNNSWFFLASNGSKFVAVSNSSASVCCVSSDGASWSDVSFGSTFSPAGITWNGVLFVVPDSGSGDVYTSADGNSWTKHTGANTITPFGVSV